MNFHVPSNMYWEWLDISEINHNCCHPTLLQCQLPPHSHFSWCHSCLLLVNTGAHHTKLTRGFNLLHSGCSGGDQLHYSCTNSIHLVKTCDWNVAWYDVFLAINHKMIIKVRCSLYGPHQHATSVGYLGKWHLIRFQTIINITNFRTKFNFIVSVMSVVGASALKLEQDKSYFKIHQDLFQLTSHHWFKY